MMKNKTIINILMWIPVVGIITGLTQLNKKYSWFDSPNSNMKFLNGCWLGLTLMILIFTLSTCLSTC